MPTITSTNYWETVFDELQAEIERNSYAKYLYIAKRYDEVIRLIENNIRAWYGRHALDNKIDLKQVYKKLPADQLKQFHDLINTYLSDWREEYGYDLKVSKEDTLTRTDEWIEILSTYSDKKSVTYWESLIIPIQNEIEKLNENTSEMLLLLVALTGFSAYDSIIKSHKLTGLNEDKIKNELLKTWSSDGIALDQRLNSMKSKLLSNVKTALVKGFRNESEVNVVVDEVSKVLGIGANAAKRLIITENTHFSVYGTYLALKDAGYKYYRIVEVLDSKTCEECRLMHGSVFNLSDYEAGVTASPFHAHCRGRIYGVE